MSTETDEIKLIESQVEVAVAQETLDFSVTQLEGVGAMTEKKLTEFGVSSFLLSDSVLQLVYHDLRTLP